MTIKFEYNEKPNLLDTKVTGVLYSSEIPEYFNRLINETELASGFIEIVDLNKAEDVVLQFTDLAEISEKYKTLVAMGHQVTIFCAYSKEAQDMLNMMLPLFHHININVFVCKSENELEENKKLFNI